ncbi:MAG TPA: hypothetical protein OIM48_04590 [Clostridiaceae bacterium]|nr:hypothetical protein [Clostridiaceae bacterium]
MLIIGYEDKSSKYIKCNSAKVRDIRWDLIKREYEKYNNIFSTYAVITPDGKWYEPGKMGWWGISSATPEQEIEFEKSYEERFIKTANPEWTLTIVDCHI